MAAAFVRVGVDDGCHKSNFLRVVGMIRSEEGREGEQTLFIKELHSKEAETRNSGHGGTRAKRDGVYLCSWGPVGQGRNSAFSGGGRHTEATNVASFLCIFSEVCAHHTHTHTHTHTHPFVTHIIAFSIQNSVPCSLHLTMCPADLFIAQYRASPLFWCLQNVPPDRCITTYLHSS